MNSLLAERTLSHSPSIRLWVWQTTAEIPHETDQQIPLTPMHWQCLLAAYVGACKALLTQKPRRENFLESEERTNKKSLVTHCSIEEKCFRAGKFTPGGLHEHLDTVGNLIHMNGRLYDADLGRFLSVDPFIQSPENSQSLNPYSYIFNNPLSGTDPTGYMSSNRTRHLFGSSAFMSVSFTGSVNVGMAKITADIKPEAKAEPAKKGNKPAAEVTRAEASSGETTTQTPATGGTQTAGAADQSVTVNQGANGNGTGGESGSGGSDTVPSTRTEAGTFVHKDGTKDAALTIFCDSSCVAKARGGAGNKEGFGAFFLNRLLSGGVRDDIFTFAGSLVSSFTFGFVEPSFTNRNSSAFGVGQVTSLVLGGAGLVRSIYFAGTRGLSALASASGSESLVLGLSSIRNASKLLSNPTLLFSSANRAVHVIPPSQRLSAAGSVGNLAKKLGTTNVAVDSTLIPLTPLIGVCSTEFEGC